MRGALSPAHGEVPLLVARHLQGPRRRIDVESARLGVARRVACVAHAIAVRVELLGIRHVGAVIGVVAEAVLVGVEPCAARTGIAPDRGGVVVVARKLRASQFECADVGSSAPRTRNAPLIQRLARAGKSGATTRSAASGASHPINCRRLSICVMEAPRHDPAWHSCDGCHPAVTAWSCTDGSELRARPRWADHAKSPKGHESLIAKAVAESCATSRRRQVGRTEYSPGRNRLANWRALDCPATHPRAPFSRERRPARRAARGSHEGRAPHPCPAGG